MKIQIKNRWSLKVQFECEIPDETPAHMRMRLAVEIGIKTGANLTGADFTRANFTGADFTDADFTGADFTDADFTGADFTRANLTGADFTGADFTGADFTRANFTGADFTDADFTGANLTGADFTRANFTRANFTRANLTGADLTGADLTRAKNAGLPQAQTIILPEGEIIGWKKLRNDVIAKLKIPYEAKRSNASGRKCRAEYADVLEVIGAEFGVSKHDGKTVYKAGERIFPDSFDENRWDECSHGIHFFITRIEAENY